jgi:preprotein translocase SecE subunit
MANFLSESSKELHHVVWPTNKETQKYFTVVVSLIVALTLFLFAVGTIFSV